MSLHSASLAPRSVPAHRPHSQRLVSKHIKGLINGKQETKSMPLTGKFCSHSFPQDQRGNVTYLRRQDGRWQSQAAKNFLPDPLPLISQPPSTATNHQQPSFLCAWDHRFLEQKSAKIRTAGHPTPSTSTCTTRLSKGRAPQPQKAGLLMMDGNQPQLDN